MPLGKLMVPSRVINIYQDLIVKRHRSELIERGRKKLNHVMPCRLILSLVESDSLALKIHYKRIQHRERVGRHSVTREVLALKFLSLYFMHSRG